MWELEATPGFEPGIRALQAPALPLGDVALRGGSLVDGLVRVKIDLLFGGVNSAGEQKNTRPSAGCGKIEFWSGRRDLNPRRQPWQGCTLPLSYSRSAPLKGEG